MLMTKSCIVNNIPMQEKTELRESTTHFAKQSIKKNLIVLSKTIFLYFTIIGIRRIFLEIREFWNFFLQIISALTLLKVKAKRDQITGSFSF
jgi:hypothetical protein